MFNAGSVLRQLNLRSAIFNDSNLQVAGQPVKTTVQHFFRQNLQVIHVSGNTADGCREHMLPKDRYRQPGEIIG